MIRIFEIEECVDINTCNIISNLLLTDMILFKMNSNTYIYVHIRAVTGWLSHLFISGEAWAILYTKNICTYHKISLLSILHNICYRTKTLPVLTVALNVNIHCLLLDC